MQKMQKISKWDREVIRRTSKEKMIYKASLNRLQTINHDVLSLAQRIRKIKSLEQRIDDCNITIRRLTPTGSYY